MSLPGMRTLILGAKGQLGRHLRHLLPQAETCARSQADHVLDLNDFQALSRLLDARQPQVILNAAAWTAVDAAEEQVDAAWALNRDLPAQLADWARGHDALLLHWSTDYVFSGQPGRAWREDDSPAPQSVYGKSKLAGEEAVMASGCRAFILRTAWVYSALPGNFISAILKRAADGQDLRVVDDQIGSPTWAGSLARAALPLLPLGEALKGAVRLHVSGQGAVSWHQLARTAVQLAVEHGIIPAMVNVEAIGGDEWPQKAQRPAWSVLDGSRYEKLTGQALPHWQDALEECLSSWRTPPC